MYNITDITYYFIAFDDNAEFIIMNEDELPEIKTDKVLSNEVLIYELANKIDATVLSITKLDKYDYDNKIYFYYSAKIKINSDLDIIPLSEITNKLKSKYRSLLDSRIVKNYISKIILNKLSKHTDLDIQYIKDNYCGRIFTDAFFSQYKISFLLSQLLKADHGKLLDPCCGSGRLLEYIDDNVSVHCFEIDKKNADICKFLYPNANIIVDDVLDHKDKLCSEFEYFIANPPWGLMANRSNYILPKRINHHNSIFYFLELCLQSLKPGGRGVFFYITSMLSENQQEELIKSILETTEIMAEIVLPKEACANMITESKILLVRNSCVQDKPIHWFNYSISSEKYLNSFDITINDIIGQIYHTYYK